MERTDARPTVDLVGSITDAKVLPDLNVGDEVIGTGVIGDEVGDPVDFDFLQLNNLAAGETVVVDIDTADPFGDLDSFVAAWSVANPLEPIALNDDGDPSSFDSRLVFDVPADGTYYISIGGFGDFFPIDPFDSASPSVGGGPGSLGDYSYSISLVQTDTDYYRFKLTDGDIVGATVFDGTSLELFDPSGTLLIGSAQDVTFVHPPSSPLPGGGTASLSYVAEREGFYTLGVRTLGDYHAQLRGFRPLGELDEDRASQILLLDLDGATFDPGIFFGGPAGFDVTLSPFSSFLPGWGLTGADEEAAIDAIVASVEENLDDDIADLGLSEDFDIEIRNSRDHADPWGQPMVSRIIIGGTIDESTIPTIGVAQSIDIGNFDGEETAIVLLDILSGRPGDPMYFPGDSLNDFPLAPGTSIIDLVGSGVGNITAHEAGHFFANWHTDQFNPSANIMDQGGNMPGMLGVGPDGVFGSADDVDVDFGLDIFNPNEGFSGEENTMNSIGYGLWSSAN